MDLEHLRTFARVVRFGSLTKAAASLGLPKSTVSRRLTELERQLGAQLIRRTTRRLSVTETGSRLFKSSEHHLLELEAVERSVRDHGGELRGTLRVTTPADMTSMSLVPIVHRFLQKHPQVKVVVTATNRRVDLVAEGMDLALRAGPLAPSTLMARRLIAGEFRLFASDDYLERRGEPESIGDLAQHECLVFNEEQPKQKWQLRSVNPPSRQQEVEVSGRFAISDFGALLRACAAGMGIALLPSQASRKELPTLGLRRVLPQWRGPDSVLHAVYPASKRVSPTLKAFIDHVAREFVEVFSSP